MKQQITFISFILVIVGVTGCVGTPVTDNVKEFNVVIMGYQYSPAEINVNLRDTVRLKVTNNDQITHGISLPVFGVQEFVNPGQTTTVEFVASQKGNPETFCSTDHGEKLLINVA